MTRDRDGEIVWWDDENHETAIRGHLTADDCREICNGYDTGYTAKGEPWHCYGHTGLGIDEYGERKMFVYTRSKPGKRGWFALTIVTVAEVDNADT